MEQRRLDPVAGSVALLALCGLALYLWLERQKAAGPLSPTWWFVGSVVVAVVVAAYASGALAARRRRALAATGLVLVLLAPLSTVTLSVPTSRPGALFWSYGLLLAAGGVLALLRSWRPGRWSRAVAVAAGALALVAVASSVLAAAGEATRGEGVGGAAAADLGDHRGGATSS